MNRKQRRVAQAQGTVQDIIQIRDTSYSFDEASALALKAYDLGHFQAAVDIYQLIIATAPAHADIYNNQGISLIAMNRFNEALACFDKALALNPDYAQAHSNRGVTLRELKRYEEALASCDKAIQLKPDYAEAHSNRGGNLHDLKRHDDALASYDKAIAFKPNFAEAHHNRGITLTNKGNMREAEKMFRKALALRPGYPSPLFSLTNIRHYEDADHADVKTIQMLLKKPNISPYDKASLYFSLGKIYDDCGHYDKAFESYLQGNWIRNAMVSYHPRTLVGVTNNIIHIFNKEFLAQPLSAASDSRLPLFVVGMPRAGTTLIASILSNHPRIDTAGELPTMIDFTLQLPGYPQAAQQITAADASRMIYDYGKRLKRDVAGSDNVYIIDKHPLNFRHLGFISRLFPKARVIHCVRHPLDTCLSNYFQRFSSDYNYAFDLRNIGHYYGEYMRMMKHWQAALPVKPIEVSYEDMILNTEPTVRKLLDSLGLEWDERCLAPHTNPCAVETASNWQVRQPIYTQSIGRWRQYAKYLVPLAEALRLTQEDRYVA